MSTYGSIPACAGEPITGLREQRGNTVYPRVCGGTIIHLFADRSYLGLSPRVRGNRHQDRPSLWRKGSIPACAGEPEHYQRELAEKRVYPRVCGGTLAWRVDEARKLGSIPACAGEPDIDLRPLARRVGGSIPACAGEPAYETCRAVTHRLRVYPRVCGGTVRLSPPWPRTGSIPACAGEPSTVTSVSGVMRVYPRVCGGTAGTPQTAPRRKGSIPACAGEPRELAGSRCLPQGLSPRVRGNRGRRQHQAG